AGEVVDLLAGAHLHADRDGARALPLSRPVLEGVEVQEPGRMVVASHHVGNVAEIERRSLRADANGHIADLTLAVELAGGRDEDVLAAGIELAGAAGEIAPA